MENHRRLLRGQQLATLRALIVRIEHEAAIRAVGRIDTLQQNHPHVRQTIRIDGRQRHGIRVIGLVGDGVLEPGIE